MNWLEVSITLTGELVEPVADVLQRVCSTGVALTPADQDETEIFESSPLTLRAFLPVDPELDSKRHRILRELAYLSMITPIPEARFKFIEEQDWGRAWKAHYRPLRVGRRLQIVPSWLAADADERLTILLDPGMAFGTGTHPSTQLCLEALEEQVQPGMLVADLGCGSGILSMAAALLGAGQVLAFDSDPEAVKTAGANVERNNLASRVQVHQGSLPELRALLNATGTRPHVTVANILAKVLTEMLRDSLSGTVREDGILILAGILDHQVKDVLQVAQGQGLADVNSPAMGDWHAILLKKRPPQ